MEEKNWYVLFVMGGKEQQLCDFLNQEENWYAFYPKIELVRRKSSVDPVSYTHLDVYKRQWFKSTG